MEASSLPAHLFRSPCSAPVDAERERIRFACHVNYRYRLGDRYPTGGRIGKACGVAMTVDALLGELRTDVPELVPVIDEHISTHDQVLPHVLLGDVTWFVVEAHADGTTGVEDRCLRVLDRALREGDEEVVNVVEASFIENVGPWDKSVRRWIDSWPVTLREAALRQAN
jgi:hypothetical protein